MAVPLRCSRDVIASKITATTRCHPVSRPASTTRTGVTLPGTSQMISVGYDQT